MRINALLKWILWFLLGIILVNIIPLILLFGISNFLLFVIEQWQVGRIQQWIILGLSSCSLVIIVICCWKNRTLITQWWDNTKLGIFLDRVGRIESPYQDYINYCRLALGLLIFGALLPIPTEFLGTPSYKLWSNVPNLDNDTYNSYINSISQILVGVSASIVAASLIEIFIGVRKIYEREELQKKIKIFFGCNNNDPDNYNNPKTAIIIHGYPLDETNALSDEEIKTIKNFADNFPYMDKVRQKELKSVLIKELKSVLIKELGKLDTAEKEEIDSLIDEFQIKPRPENTVGSLIGQNQELGRILTQLISQIEKLISSQGICKEKVRKDIEKHIESFSTESTVGKKQDIITPEQKDQIKKILYSDNEYGSKADVMAANYIQRLFNKNGFNPPGILNDNLGDTKFEKLLQEDKYNCFIIIGIGNNNFIHYLLHTHQPKPTGTRNNILFDPQNNEINCKYRRKNNQDEDVPLTNSSPKSEYGQLLKFKVLVNKTDNNDTIEKVVFILGGNTALYTEKLAKYLFENFDDNSSNEPNKNFYALYKNIHLHRYKECYSDRDEDRYLTIENKNKSFNFIAEFDAPSNPDNIDDIKFLRFPCLAFEDKRGDVYPISAEENFDNFDFI